MKEKNLSLSDLELENSPSAYRVKQVGEQRRAIPTKVGLLKEKFKTLFSNRLFLLISIVSLVVIISGSWLIYSVIVFTPTSTKSLVDYNGIYLEVGIGPLSVYSFKPVSEPSEPKEKINPLNGRLLSASQFDELKIRRPVAVMINNHVAARPQSSIVSADIVYETLAESGITRYMPIYWENAVSKVGPIRSVRQYHLELLGEYDATFIHDGYASSSDLRVDAGGNIRRYRVNSISTQGAWRENSRIAPHNEYSSVANALNIAERNGWRNLPTNFMPWKFSNDPTKDERGDHKGVSITMHKRLSNNGLYDSEWRYDRESNSYLRYIGKQPDTDLESGVQLSSKTIIVQKVKLVNTFDDLARIILEVTGEGDAKIVQNGSVIDARWEKKSRTERTIYYSKSDNSEIEFNRGLLWVVILANEEGEFAIIE